MEKFIVRRSFRFSATFAVVELDKENVFARLLHHFALAQQMGKELDLVRMLRMIIGQKERLAEEPQNIRRKTFFAIQKAIEPIEAEVILKALPDSPSNRDVINALARSRPEEFYLKLLLFYVTDRSDQADVLLKKKILILASKANGRTSPSKSAMIELDQQTEPNWIRGDVTFEGVKEPVEVKIPIWGKDISMNVPESKPAAWDFAKLKNKPPKAVAPVTAVSVADPVEITITDQDPDTDSNEQLIDLDLGDFLDDDAELDQPLVHTGPEDDDDYDDEAGYNGRVNGKFSPAQRRNRFNLKNQ